MKYIVGVIVVIIALIIVGFIWRKRVYDQIDQLEGWKLDIRDRNVSEELNKVKRLNLSGETEERFESWRERWESILTRTLPEIEDDLFKMEEAVDKFHFQKLKKQKTATEDKLDKVENEIKEMMEELNSLLTSEESARQEAEELQPELDALKKRLIKDRYGYGEAVHVFEGRIDNTQEKIHQFEKLSEEGNYLEAEELIRSVRTDVDQLKEETATFPDALRKCKKELPKQCEELQQGILEMKDQGYRIDHLGFEEELHRFQEDLRYYEEKMEAGESIDYSDVCTMEARITEMYNQLEEEALAVQTFAERYEAFSERLRQMTFGMREVEEEAEIVKQAYQFSEEDMEALQQAKSTFYAIVQADDEMRTQMDDGETPFTRLLSQLNQEEDRLNLLDKEKAHVETRLEDLREEEWKANERIVLIEQDLKEINRKLRRSNLPGLPREVVDIIEKARLAVDEAFGTLEEVPLEMDRVHEKIDEAEDALQVAHERSREIMELSRLTERLIQYGNKYRTSRPLVAAELTEAEKEFRMTEYSRAFERTSKVLEKIEPGVVDRFREQEEVTV
ncbi:septation ring formation regulator EzrA [Salimicrobium album]|uniref:Septation ring formation regulator EzrA n=1 Tax=Salimicrobium album TaxID=50717 RepID=A0A1H3CX85_9BACI|nr:septation ring formation regulator EzrA [Salimicrobium album]SDX58696.1 septation ring formation regulator [Salimicrobium album]